MHANIQVCYCRAEYSHDAEATSKIKYNNTDPERLWNNFDCFKVYQNHFNLHAAKKYC